MDGRAQSHPAGGRFSRAWLLILLVYLTICGVEFSLAQQPLAAAQSKSPDAPMPVSRSANSPAMRSGLPWRTIPRTTATWWCGARPALRLPLPTASPEGYRTAPGRPFSAPLKINILFSQPGGLYAIDPGRYG